MKSEYNRIKIIVKLITGEEYRFVTEYESNISTLWHYDILGNIWLKIYNDNGKEIKISLSKILYWYPVENILEDIIKEVSPKIFEFNDYQPVKNNEK